MSRNRSTAPGSFSHPVSEDCAMCASPAAACCANVVGVFLNVIRLRRKALLPVGHLWALLRAMQ